MPIVSLCIPTNGMTEWVLPVLDSIYSSNIDEDKYEVVIEDNGDRQDFFVAISEYKNAHSNLKYYRSTANGFLCQIDCFKHADGEFIKFVNHRARLVTGALGYLIKYAEVHIDDKPVSFFSNGTVVGCECDSFDEFVEKMGYFSSWSNGLSFWKTDLYLIDSIESFNSTFPHTDLLFLKRNSNKYIISNEVLFDEINAGHASKGKYNLFKAFAVEYPSIICDLMRNNDISAETFLSVKNKLLNFLADLFIQFIIHKEPASYSFDNYREYLSVYYTRNQLETRIIKRRLGHLKRRITRLFIKA